MGKPKTIQISYDLFQDLFLYSVRHLAPDDPQFTRLYKGVKEKIEAMMRHDLYSLYKSGATEEIRSEARQKYLDEIGLLDSFRWDDEQDMNVARSTGL